MIGSISGEIILKNEKFIILEAGGVGYRIYLFREISQNIGEYLRVFTYLVVKDDALDLYGFQDVESLEIFELLLKVSGIGPKTAMTICSSSPRESIVYLISKGESEKLSKTAGVSKKVAEKIVLELKDKMSHLASDDSWTEEGGDIIDILISFGYKESAVRSIIKMIPKEKDIKEQIKIGLSLLSK